MENEETAPEVPVKRKAGRPPRPKGPAPSPSFSMEQMAELAQMLRQPTILEQKKLDEAEAQQTKLRKMKVEAATRELAVKTQRQNGCSHHSPDGNHRFRAQVNTDGYFRPICLICQKEYPPIKATDEQRVGGVNLGAYKNLTEKAILNWAKASDMVGAA